MQRLKVTASCPSCGAPFDFLEGANVAKCNFCGLPLLFLSQKKILRYYLKPKLTRGEIPFLIDRYRKKKGQSLSKRTDEIKRFYLPFWRFTAEVFYTIINNTFLDFTSENLDDEIMTKDWDISFAAHTTNDLGIVSLGMRPEWLELSLLTEKDILKKEEVLNLEIDSPSAKEKALKPLYFYIDKKKSSEDELVLRLLEQRLSLIYFPLWVVNFTSPEGEFFQIIDGITKRTLKQGRGNFELKKERKEDAAKLYPLKIIPHRCPNCGWDLPVNQFHLVFPCENCERIWKLSEKGYREVKGEKAKPKQKYNSHLPRSLGYYPFWVFQTEIPDKKRLSIQDVLNILPSEIGLFKVVKKSNPFLFYIPAFEIKNLKKVPDISLAFTRTQPDLSIQPAKNENLKGVFISEEDAKELAEILWTSLLSSKQNINLGDWRNLKFERGKIIWIPFYQDGIFLRDAEIGYGFQKVSVGAYSRKR